MPGMANWKTLYSLEYQQLKGEGYPVGDELAPTEKEDYFPFPEMLINAKDSVEVSGQHWEKAYYELCKVREKGIRADYPYSEPNSFEEIIKDAEAPPLLDPLDSDTYKERIKGAWFGRCAAVVLGKPFEFNVDREYIKKYLESVEAYPLDDFVPGYSESLDVRLRNPKSTKGNISYVEDDDDTRYTILALLLTEKFGFDFTTYDVCQNVLENVPYTELWSAMKQSIYNFINMTEDRPLQEQVDEFKTKLNPMREGINGVIRADFWGYVNPGEPRKAAKVAYREASLNMVKSGLYGSMFVAACISAALSKNPTIETILQAGMSVIPRKSRFANMVNEVRHWYTTDGDWTVTCDRIYEKYGHLPFAGGLNNMAMVILGLLHGGLDFTKAITTTVMCGIDTDCNSGTVGSIVSAAIGYDGIDSKWITPFNDTIRTCAARYTYGSITELVERTVQAYEKTKEN